MKKRMWLIPIAVVGVLLTLLVAFCGIMLNKGYGMSQGVYLEAKDGQAMFIRQNSPIEMANRTNRELFDDLDMGDEILVIHDGIAESYPGKTGVYAIFKLSDGNAADIPQKVIDQLVELGWFEAVVED